MGAAVCRMPDPDQYEPDTDPTLEKKRSGLRSDRKVKADLDQTKIKPAHGTNPQQKKSGLRYDRKVKADLDQTHKNNVRNQIKIIKKNPDSV